MRLVLADDHVLVLEALRTYLKSLQPDIEIETATDFDHNALSPESAREPYDRVWQPQSTWGVFMAESGSSGCHAGLVHLSYRRGDAITELAITRLEHPLPGEATAGADGRRRASLLRLARIDPQDILA